MPSPNIPFSERPLEYPPTFSEGDVVQYALSYVGRRYNAEMRFIARNIQPREVYNNMWTADLYQIHGTTVSSDPSEHFSRFFDLAEPIAGLRIGNPHKVDHKIGVPKGKLP